MIAKNNINFNFWQTCRSLDPNVRNLIEDYVDSFMKNNHIIFCRKYIRKIMIKYYVSFVYDLWNFWSWKNERALRNSNLYYKKFKI